MPFPLTPPVNTLFLDWGRVVGHPYEPWRPVYAFVWQDEARTLLWSGEAWVPVSDLNLDYSAITLPETPPGSRRFGPVPMPAKLPAGEYIATYWQRPSSRPAHQGYAIGPFDIVTATGGGSAPLPPAGLDCQIASVAAGPASATMPDGRSATAHPLPDLIATEKYLASKRAAAAGRAGWGGLGRSRGVMPGAV